jgi:flagellar biosynthesis/type III secretory pathway chaperone
MSIQPLTETLEKLIELHQVLLKLAQEKTPVIVKDEVERLSAIMSQENKLLKQVADLDRQRVERTSEYLQARGYAPNPNVTISDLIRMIFKVEDKKMMQVLQQRLLESISELRKANDLNQKLIEQSLQFINYSIDLLTGAPDQDATYRNPQQQGYGTARAGLFDTRA